MSGPDKFTADDAFEASKDGDPITLDTRAVSRMLDQHSIDDSDRRDFWNDVQPCSVDNGYDEYDAADVLGWLGY